MQGIVTLLIQVLGFILPRIGAPNDVMKNFFNFAESYVGKHDQDLANAYADRKAQLEELKKGKK